MRQALGIVVVVSGAWFFVAAAILREGTVFPPRKDHVLVDLLTGVPMFIFVIFALTLGLFEAVS